MNHITAVSAFNGLGGAALALTELNIHIKKLYSFEIDKFAIQAAQLLFPDTVQLGDITQWKKSPVYNLYADILLAGFPCQAWSMAGKQKGDTDPRGALVHDLLELWAHLKSVNPNLKIMFENVAMKKEFMDYINNLFGVQPVMINAALVTAQNRKRNYWMNWEVNQPEDLGILLKDIIEHGSADREKSLCVTTRVAGATEKRYLEKSQHQMIIERPCELRGTEIKDSALCHHVATATDIKANESNKRIYADTGKAPTLTTMGGGHREPKVLVNKPIRVGILGRDSMGYRVYSEDGKSPCMMANTTGGNKPTWIGSMSKYRKLTPKECMRLQGLPEWAIDRLLESGISNSQLYKMVGNGWAHPVIVHNLKALLNTGWMQKVSFL